MAIQPNIYTVSNIIEQVKTDAMTPTNQALFDDKRMCTVINKALLGSVQSQIMQCQADFFLTYEEFQVEQNVSRYPLPKRATKLKDVMWVTNNSGPAGTQSFLAIPQIDQSTISSWNWQTASYAGFMIEGNEIVLYPSNPIIPNPNQLIRLYYYRPPNSVVPENQGAIISFVDEVNKTVTLSNIPTLPSGSPWTVGNKVDIVRPYPPFNTILESIPITSINQYVIGLESVEGIEVGDSIALENQSLVAQIPYSLYPLLSQAAAIQVMKDMGDKDGEALARKAYAELAAMLFVMLAPRVDNRPKRINGSAGISLYTKNSYPWGTGSGV